MDQWEIPEPGPEGSGRIAVAASDGGDVYVADPHGGEVHRFSPTGQKEWSIGMRGDGPLQFLLPLAVATDSPGNVYVLDAVRHQVYRFDVSRRLR